MTKKIIQVRGRDISLIPDKVNDYISLTDIARYRDAERNTWGYEDKFVIDLNITYDKK